MITCWKLSDVFRYGIVKEEKIKRPKPTSNWTEAVILAGIIEWCIKPMRFPSTQSLSQFGSVFGVHWLIRPPVKTVVLNVGCAGVTNTLDRRTSFGAFWGRTQGYFFGKDTRTCFGKVEYFIAWKFRGIKMKLKWPRNFYAYAEI